MILSKSFILATGRPTVDTHAEEVVPRVLCGRRFVPENLIRKAGITKFFRATSLKDLERIGSAHPVDLHHDEADVGDG